VTLAGQCANGASGGRGAVFHAELDENLLEVFVDRARADVQDRADLAVGLAAAQPQEHFRFAGSELQALLQDPLVTASADFGQARR